MKTTRITLSIDNMRCGGALTIERALLHAPGVVHIYVNPVIEMAYVEYDPLLTTSDLLVAAIGRTGFRVGVPEIR
jgi:cation transport ATPase